jgi:hypothetical protein
MATRPISTPRISTTPSQPCMNVLRLRAYL